MKLSRASSCFSPAVLSGSPLSPLRTRGEVGSLSWVLQPGTLSPGAFAGVSGLARLYLEPTPPHADFFSFFHISH